MSIDLSKLNPKQREAVLHGNGPLLILAGAGSGKTNTMTHRIAHLIAARNVPAHAILGLSFTNKAATELKERVRRLVTEVAGPRGASGLTVSTFHSLCVRLLRVNAERLGFSRDFTILDQKDQEDILRAILRNLKIDDRKFKPGWVLFQIGQAKNRFLTPDAAEAYLLGTTGSMRSADRKPGEAMPEDYSVAAASSYGRYQEQLRILNAMDFDDLLYYTVKLLEEHDDVRDRYNEVFRHILVDEYQDTNQAQFRLLSALTRRHQNICVVGDDDQSIYAWRGADPTHILNFNHHYPAARTITLDQNYRSTSTILDAANEVISKNTKRHPKKLWSDRGEGEPIIEVICEDDRDEADTVAWEIRELAYRFEGGERKQIRPWKDFAILYRSNAQSRLFEEALRVHQIPYKIVGGMSFLDRKEIKDVLSYWRLLVNPHDDASLRRIINWPSRGIGKTSLESLNQHALSSGKSLFDALADAPTVAPRARTGAAELRDLILSLRKELATVPPLPAALSRWARDTLDHFGVRKALEEENDDPVQAAKKWENVDELANSIGQIDVRELLESVSDPAAAGDQTGAEMLDQILAAPVPKQPKRPAEPEPRDRMGWLDAMDRDEDEDPAEEDLFSAVPVGMTGASAGAGAGAFAAGPPVPPEALEAETLQSEVGENFGAAESVTIFREFLARLTLGNDDQENDDAERDELTLLTLHGSKGLEYPIVFMVGAEDGTLPHKRVMEEAGDLSEERRLCYVGITRARDQLFITRCRNRVRYGKQVPRSRSRFLEDIPEHLVLFRNQAQGPDLSSPEAKDQHEQKVSDFLAKIRQQLGQ